MAPLAAVVMTALTTEVSDGRSPIQVANFYRDQRVQTLSTHCQAGIVLSSVFLSLSFKDAAKLADFVENTSRGHCHLSARIGSLCIRLPTHCLRHKQRVVAFAQESILPTQL
jgi:hypothetical protein